MSPTECKFCGFTENTAELCSVCGNEIDFQTSAVAPAANPTVRESESNLANSFDGNINRNRPPRTANCADCGAKINGFRRLCGVCEQKGEKSGFNFLRLAAILTPLLVLLLFTIWLFYFYFEDPVKKAVRNFEAATAITSDLKYDNYRITGTGSVKVRLGEPDERGRFETRENELAFEMIFTNTDQFYVNFYREPKEALISNTNNTVYQAGSNGYRHWQSVLAKSNLGVNQTYKHSVKDTDGFPNILHKDILRGLSDIKTFDQTTASECRGIPPEAARIVMPPKLYTIEGVQHTAHTCENVYLSVLDKKGFSSLLGFDPLTGVLLTEKGGAIIEDKQADIIIDYATFKEFSIKVKNGNAEEPKVILIPTALSIIIVIDNLQAAVIKLTIKNIETNAAIDPLVFEKPIL